MSKQSKKVNLAIRRVQAVRGFTRTNAIQWLGMEYGLAYATLHILAKHGKMPRRQNSIEAIDKLIKDYA